MLLCGGVIIWVATAGVLIKQSKQMEPGTEQKNKTISCVSAAITEVRGEISNGGGGAGCMVV